MTIPTILFGLLIAMFCGAIYHLLRGGTGWQLLLYFGWSILGFAVGHYIGVWRGWSFLMVGSINLGTGLIGSAIFLYGGDWLSRIDEKNESSV